MTDSKAAFTGRHGYITPFCAESPQGTKREISFTIPGALGGKGRPRFTSGKCPGSPNGKSFVRTYTPAKTLSDEAIVRQYADQAIRALIGNKVRIDSMFVGPLEVTIHIQRVPPQSWSKSKKAGAKWLTGKPDCDNQAKLILDAMNGIVYTDDSQLSVLQIQRTYGPNNSVSISVAELT